MRRVGFPVLVTETLGNYTSAKIFSIMSSEIEGSIVVKRATASPPMHPAYSEPSLYSLSHHLYN